MGQKILKMFICLNNTSKYYLWDVSSQLSGKQGHVSHIIFLIFLELHGLIIAYSNKAQNTLGVKTISEGKHDSKSDKYNFSWGKQRVGQPAGKPII